MSLVSILIDTLFPERCVGCKTRGTSLCEACLSSSRPPHQTPHDWISALYSYKEPKIKKSVWLLKYKNRKRLAGVFGKAIADQVLLDMSDELLFYTDRKIVLVPIPISKQRRKERGYNQSTLISEILLKILNTPHVSLDETILFKSKEIIRQSHTRSRTERLHGITGSFSVTRPCDPRAWYILIDDVTTTGATLDEARKVLRKAGARKIHAYVLAH